MIKNLMLIQREFRRRFRVAYHSYLVRKRAAACGEIVRANYKTQVTDKTYIANNFNSNGLLVIGRGQVSIGENFHCGFGCVIITENHNHQGDALPYDDTYCLGDVAIGDNVWLGINVTILPNVSIGEGAIVQAGSVVVNDIPECGIAGGHPAVVFSQRDREHYQTLKHAGKFH